MKNIIQGCRQRNVKAQKLLYTKHVDRLYYIIYRYTKDRFEIENLLQDVFLKIFNKIDSFDANKGSFATWSRTIAIRTALNGIKKSKIDFSYIEDYPELENVIAVSDIDNYDAEELLDLINSISDKYRIMFNLYEIDGYSHDDISKLLGITASTSRSSLTRAKKIIRKKILKSKLKFNGSTKQISR